MEVLLFQTQEKQMTSLAFFTALVAFFLFLYLREVREWKVGWAVLTTLLWCFIGTVVGQLLGFGTPGT